tara:strand:+ start:1100 stop:2008 length:909 start_codon:yes stop_codon:yes gene_type:complete
MTSGQSSEVIVFEIDDFLRIKSAVVDERIRKIVRKIIDDHECFSHNYRYTPSKDQNYQHKLNNYYKKNSRPNKLVSDTDIDTRKCYSLLNKLSKSNYESILKSIKSLLNNSSAVFVGQFLGKMLSYSELSDLYLDAIIETVKELCKEERNKKVLEINFEKYFCQYIDKIRATSYKKWLDEFDYDDYDSFCEWKKKSRMLLNQLNSVIKISHVADMIVNLVQIYEENMNSIQYLLDSKTDKNGILIHDHFEHIETILRETDLVETIGCDIQKLHLLCIEAREEAPSSKLRFKIDDLMREQSFI